MKYLVAVLLIVLVPTVGQAARNRHLVQGIKLLDNAEDEKALEAFQQALAWPGAGPKQRARIHIYLGITQLNLSNDEAARTHLRTALTLDPAVQLPKGVSPKIEQLMARVREEKPPVPDPVEPPPRVVPTPVEVVPAPVEPVVTRRSSSPWSYWPAWAALGLGVAAGGAGLALGLVSRNKSDQASDLSIPTADAESSHDTAKTMALSANILFAVAGAAAIATGVLFYLGSRQEQSTMADVVPLRGGALVQLRGATW